MTDDYGFFAPAGVRPPPPQTPPPPAPYSQQFPPPGQPLPPPAQGFPPPYVPPYGTGRPGGHYPIGAKMGFFDKISSGLTLARTCWTVLSDEPALLLVPVVTMLASALVIVPFLLLTGGIANPDTDRVLAGFQAVTVGIVLAAIGNVGTAVIVSAATTRLQGLHPDLRAAWSAALAKLPALAGLGVLVVLERSLSNLLRRNLLGRLVAGLIDSAWDFATFLTIPVVLFEDAGAMRSVKRSGQLVVSRWGSQLTASSILNLAVFVCALPLLIGMVLLGAMMSPLLAMAMFCVWLVLVVSVSTALSGILSAAMYRFAVTGLVVPGFREADMWRMFSRAS